MTDSQQAVLFTNGRFFTSKTSGAEFHSCMVVKDGKIQYIGNPDSAEIQHYQSQNIQVQDLKNRYVLPGFIDGHCHFLLLGQSLKGLSLDGCQNLTDIRSRISAFANANPDKPRLLCGGWMHSMTNGEAKASMIDDLDPRPIYIYAKDLHSTWCNSAALQEMAVQEMEDPAGGTIERDADGNASGLLSEACVLLIIWPYLASVASLAEKTAALRVAIDAYHSVGYTGCIDMAMDLPAWTAILALREEMGGQLPLRIAAHWIVMPGSSERERLLQVDKAIEMATQYNKTTSPDLRIVGIKIICDGVIDACTAALSEPYTTTPNTPSCGPIWTSAMLAPVVEKACTANLQCALHAIGDAAVDVAIDAISTYGKPGQRHRIEHLELTSPTAASRLASLGITASIQPVHSDPAILRAWPSLLGPARLRRAFAYNDFSAHGCSLAIGSDAPTAPHAPLPNLYVATTRRSAREADADPALEPVNEEWKLGLVEAVSAATRGSAYSCFAEERVGSLGVGMLADFVVVDMRFEAEALLGARVRETWVGGRKVFEG
ncbi:amidohydrolase 3 [Lophiostoma macrostomum CBS 122681]|uniref:Amidohydrolase 3 n=1 Tax=Lophiostoma macrostomum CBS 122681 TaxID=1314788 RepID=A0A6A6SYL7_9PLEO|nr:amidohydrolase 3 [Lophiostoma macrostomum CBS 122681]